MSDRTVPAPPQAPRHPHEHREHGLTRSDPWAWMRDHDSAELLAHLVAEREWYDTSCAHLSSLRSELFSEMAARVPAREVSPEWRRLRFSYYTRHRSNSDYPQISRRFRPSNRGSAEISVSSTTSNDGFHASDESGEPAEEVILDVAELADTGGHLELGVTLVSPDEDLLAWSVDTTGEEVYRLRFRDLRTGRDLPDEVPRTYYGGAWSADSRWFFYTVHDAAYRPHEVWRHRLGTPANADVRVLAEPDAAFELTVRGTRSGDLVVLRSESRTTGECWVVDAHHPEEPPRSVGGRRPGVVYRVEHVRERSGGEHLLVVTDDGAPEHRLARAPVPRAADQTRAAWLPVRGEVGDERLERVDAFADHLVLSLRRRGEHVLRLLSHGDPAGEGLLVRSRFPGGAVHLARSTEYDAQQVTVHDRAHLHPGEWRSVDLRTGAATVVARQEAPGHDPAAYLTERRRVPSADGTPVPVTLLRHRDTPLDGTAPAVLWAYGAYEYTFEPEFDPALPSLLDRGVVFAHVHVRGGGEGGRRWWLDGRLDRKQHTFTDHCAVADALAGEVDGARLGTRGLSAGGLLQAVVLSQRPERWRAVVAEVPFVDVVTTMLDPTLPLTANEWEEWGDPRRPEEHAWLLAYSPMDNLPPAGGRPDLLVTGALHDPRVGVHEPAKWVAALRASDPDWSPRCVFRAETGAGAHTGPSGRFGHLAYEAEVLAWLLDRLGAREISRNC